MNKTDTGFLVLLDFVAKHWETMTDGEIARVFRTTASSVLVARRKLGLKRHHGTKIRYS